MERQVARAQLLVLSSAQITLASFRLQTLPHAAGQPPAHFALERADFATSSCSFNSPFNSLAHYSTLKLPQSFVQHNHMAKLLFSSLPSHASSLVASGPRLAARGIVSVHSHLSLPPSLAMPERA